MQIKRLAVLATSGLAMSLALTACGGSGFSDNTTAPTSGTSTAAGGGESQPAAEANTNEVSLLIGSSGDAESKAVEDAAAAWSAESGIPTKVIVASDLNQQAAQGFASGSPADILYVSTDQVAAWTAAGNLLAYGDQLENKDDFYPALRDAFTVDGQFYCAPKDFSTLQLIVNTDMWEAAGLTEADYPTTWEQLATVSKTLTKDGVVGLSMGPEVQRVGVFMAEAGGGMVTDGAATANSEANVEGLTYLQGLMKEGSAAFSSDLGAGWGGEAFGKGLSAMVIEGNWITGAMKNDFPDVKYKAIELPAGKEKGTLQYTNCWGVTAKSDNQAGAIDLVKYLTSTDQQLAFAKAFGVMPSVASAKDAWISENPEMEAFILGADYAQNLPAMEGAADVIKDFNSQLAGLKDGDVKAILDSVQGNLEAIVG